jgi:hypothetical protein
MMKHQIMEMKKTAETRLPICDTGFMIHNMIKKHIRVAEDYAADDQDIRVPEKERST